VEFCSLPNFSAAQQIGPNLLLVASSDYQKGKFFSIPDFGPALKIRHKESVSLLIFLCD
jgi:hypothetical protein